jgi:hypothetical protein
MVNKRGFLKTLEAVIAIIIFLIFMVSALVFNQAPQDQGVPMDVKAIQETVFSKIGTDLELRQCIIEYDSYGQQCLGDEMVSLIPSQTMEYEFEVCLNDPPSCPIVSDLPEDTEEITVYADSMIIQEDGESAIFRLFIWKKLQE